MEYCLTTEALSKHYREFKALNNLSMHVPKGAIYGFVGKNGSGKTTLIRLICGLQRPTSGTFTLYGVTNTDNHIHKSRRRIGAVVETPSIYLDFFIGTEYSDGTMRNKLMVGHSRVKVYLANLITILFTGFAQFAAYTLAALTAGMTFVGDMVWSRLYRPAETMALAFLSICISAAIAVLISMVIMDKPKAVLINALLSVLLLAAGASALKGLLQPEMTKRLYIPETGVYKLASDENLPGDDLLIAEDVPNPKYLSGVERKVYECISAVLPTAQALSCSIVDEEGFNRFSALHVFGTMVVVIVISGGGILIFMKRDIK